MDFQSLHQKALSLAKRFRQAQAELLDILQTIDQQKIFRKLGYSSTFEYCVSALGLSENDTYAFIRVARKSTEVPELKEAVQKGEINLTAAKRVSSVIEPDNKSLWLEKAATLPQRKLEMEIVKENPKELCPDRITPVREDRSEIRFSLAREIEKLVRRVQDLESQRQQRPCDLEQATKAMAEAYLKMHDPIKKAERHQKKLQPPSHWT